MASLAARDLNRDYSALSRKHSLRLDRTTCRLDPAGRYIGPQTQPTSIPLQAFFLNVASEWVSRKKKSLGMAAARM